MRAGKQRNAVTGRKSGERCGDKYQEEEISSLKRAVCASSNWAYHRLRFIMATYLGIAQIKNLLVLSMHEDRRESKGDPPSQFLEVRHPQ